MAYKKPEKEMCKFKLFCNHPVTGKIMESKFEVHQDDLLFEALAEAYRVMELAPYIPMGRCRLVKYDDYFEAMDQSFDLDKFGNCSFGKLVGGAQKYYSFEMFLETCKENETFKKYNKRGMKLKIAVIDLVTGEVGPAKPMRAEQGWTVGELKQYIGELFNLDSSCMRLVLEVYYDGRHLANDSTSLKGEGLYRKHTLFAVSDPEDYKRLYKESQMYRHVEAHVKSILLNITIPPRPEEPLRPQDKEELEEEVKSKPSTGGRIMKVVSKVEEEKGKKREIQIRVDRRTTLAQLKEKLVSLIGVPATGFKVYRVYNNNQEYEMERLGDSLMAIRSESKFVVRLCRALQMGEHRIKVFLLHINNTEFFNLMMESYVAKNTSVKDFKKQIIEEAKVQGVDCVLELDKMRLRKKTQRSPGTVYLDHQLIDKDIHVYAGSEMYVEPLKEPEKMVIATQMQVYVRRWRPSQCSVDPTDEVILDTASPMDLKRKLSELSGVPVDDISVAKGVGSFPAEISCLDVENELEWNPAITSISQTPFSLYDDGGVIYYKDNREVMKGLAAEERAEIQKAENVRVNSVGVFGTGSSSSSSSSYSYYRKERALNDLSRADQLQKEKNQKSAKKKSEITTLQGTKPELQKEKDDLGGAASADDVFVDADPSPAVPVENKSIELSSFSTSNRSNTNVVEGGVSFVVTDETNPNWQSSRFNFVLPLSTSIDSLHTQVAYDAGYVNGTFLLVWRRQDEEEIALDHCSTATLLEMGMAEEPKRTYLLIRTKDDAQPEKVQNEHSTSTEAEREVIDCSESLITALQGAKTKLQKEKDDLTQLLTQSSAENTRLREENTQLRGQVREMEEKVAAAENSWKVSHKEVTLTPRKLGSGGWGEVIIGKFRGQKVAVKRFHDAIMNQKDNQYYLEMLNREINTMAQLRHPNLLQFIGAVLDHPSGHPMIITEVMDTSLRDAYDRKILAPNPSCRPVILSIMRDVAVGLNYLHCLPDPIIHRDVSSANVLLESKGPGKWKTKISDFGSAKMARAATTKAAGAMVYSAPECLQSVVDFEEKKQSPKADVFSFGILLCETLTCQFPAHGVFRKLMEQVHSRERFLHSLIASCVEKNPEKRPTMERVIEQLDQA